MPRFGYVQKIEGERVRISTSRRGVCEGCSGRSSCSFDSATGSDVPEVVIAYNPIGAKLGDYVEFDLPGHTELRVSLLVWTVPLVGLAAGAFAGASTSPVLGISQDPATLLGAAIGFFTSFFLLMIYDRHAAADTRLIPRILKIAHCPDEKFR